MPSPPRPRRQIGARVDQDLVPEVRVLAARKRPQFNMLIEEALQDLLKK